MEMSLFKAREIIKKYQGKEGVLITILQEIQDVYGFLPKDTLEIVAQERSIPPATLFGIVTFYSQFKLSPCGEHIIKVCHGTACHVTGAERITEAIVGMLNIKEGETTSDSKFTLEKVACLGCCSLAPCIMIDDKVYGKLTADKAKRVIKRIAHDAEKG
ncbi:NADH-quinone oxidoreductase subunit NuoE [candidate division WOR-3 bacterium]|nr:NADH-quinone oxidoreductase subunit NuoE [candidate division WOR-3 bacterium]